MLRCFISMLCHKFSEDVFLFYTLKCRALEYVTFLENTSGTKTLLTNRTYIEDHSLGPELARIFFFYFLFFKLFTQKFCPLYEKFIRFVFLVFDLYIDRQPTNLFVLILVSLNVDGMLFSNKKINNKNNKKKFYPKKRKKKSL